jgi:uncharacterized membrane protein YoaK (UPF0700 family)
VSPATNTIVSPASGPIPQRTFGASALLAAALCSIAGAMNAGGFFAVGSYTSHVSGHCSQIGDQLALGALDKAVRFLALVFVFCIGAITSTLLIEHDLSETRRIRYLKPLSLELFLLLLFAALGVTLDTDDGHPLALVLSLVLCFTMGLQNAMVTKIQGAVVRTTHMTGVVTDLGIELGRLTLLLRDLRRERAARASRAEPLPPAHYEAARLLKNEGQRAALHCLLLSSFVGGATVGAVSFLKFRYLGALPIAVALAGLIAVEVLLIFAERGEAAVAMRLAPPAPAATAVLPVAVAPPKPVVEQTTSVT